MLAGGGTRVLHGLPMTAPDAPDADGPEQAYRRRLAELEAEREGLDERDERLSRFDEGCSRGEEGRGEETYGRDSHASEP